MIQPAPKESVMAEEGYYVWCGSVTKDRKGVYHLFYSRWKKEYGYLAWVTHSEIAHATAPSLFGPFTFQDVALPARGAQYWDGLCTHNPTVQKFGKKYYLYYMGNTGDGKVTEGLNWVHRNNQRIGVAVADSPWGPWERFDRPLIDVSEDDEAPDALMTSNPSVTRCPDGSYLCVYKAVGKHRALPFGGPVVHLTARSDSPTGPFVKNPRTIFDVEGCDFPAEDPFVWCQDGKYYAVAKDMGGHFQSNPLRSIVLFESADGLDWKVSENAFVTDVNLKWDDGMVERMTYVERPQIYFEKGRPAALSVAVGNAEMTETYNVRIPLKKQ